MTTEVTHVVRPIISFVSLNDRVKSVLIQQQDHTSIAGPGRGPKMRLFFFTTLLRAYQVAGIERLIGQVPREVQLQQGADQA